MKRDDIQTPESDLNWPAARAITPIEEGTLQVWCAVLRQRQEAMPKLAQVLSNEERQRAARFGTDTLRHHYLTSRLVLRMILAAQLNQPPEELRFETDRRGKPRLAGQAALQFNISHSADLLLLAITRSAAVGVDVERIRAMEDAMGIATRFFSPREAEWLGGLAEADRHRAFFELWTRKEAVLKATGEGISAGLAGVEMLEADGRLAVTCERPAGRRWTLAQLDPAPGFVGAFALPVEAHRVELHAWRPIG